MTQEFDMGSAMNIVSSFMQEISLDELKDIDAPEKINVIYKIENSNDKTTLKCNMEIFPTNEKIAELIPKIIVAFSKMSKDVDLTIKKA